MTKQLTLGLELNTPGIGQFRFREELGYVTWQEDVEPVDQALLSGLLYRSQAGFLNKEQRDQ